MAEKLKTAEADNAKLQQRVEELEGRVAALKELNAELRGKIVDQVKASPFVEHEGVLWKREADGGVKPIAYCPSCQLAMHSGIGTIEFNFHVAISKPFQPYLVEKIAEELS